MVTGVGDAGAVVGVGTAGEEQLQAQTQQGVLAQGLRALGCLVTWASL